MITFAPKSKIIPIMKFFKISIFILSAALFFACQQQSSQNFTLTGKTQATGMAYLQDRVSGKMVTLDSVAIENGSFTFTGSLQYPQMLYLRIDGVPGRLGIFMENAPIQIAVESLEPLQFTVKGSQSHEIFEGLTTLLVPVEESMRNLEKEILDAEVLGNTEQANRLREAFDKAELSRKEMVKEYIKPFSNMTVAVFIANRQLQHGASPEELREIFSGFNKSLKGTLYYDEMETSVIALERVAIGQPAVDFTLADTEGNQVSLSDLQGKVVLISFWASWCPYCRKSNPELVKVYKKFAGRNFEVLGVSLDRNREAWLKGVEEDGLKWIHVSDLVGWQSGPAAKYAVRSIPQNVLVDVKGTIIGRNLKYSELEAILENMLRGV